MGYANGDAAGQPAVDPGRSARAPVSGSSATFALGVGGRGEAAGHGAAGRTDRPLFPLLSLSPSAIPVTETSFSRFAIVLTTRSLTSSAARGSVDEALAQFYHALQLDPNFASAYAMAGWCHLWRKTTYTLVVNRYLRGNNDLI
jgi:hypothetical protein